jgi:uncharacterized protein (TIGR02099 family)
MTVFQTLIRRAKTLLWTAFSIVVIFAVLGIGKLLIPYSDRYQPRLEAWLSEEFGQPVVLESFAGEWTAFGPRLTLQGMKLLAPETSRTADPQGASASVVIESAALDIKPLSLLLPGFPLYNFRVIGADFELLRSADGQFRLSGFGVSGRGEPGQGSALRELARVGEVVLQDSSLAYRDEKYGIQLDFTDVSGRLHLEGDELASEIQANLFDHRSELIIAEVEGTILLSLDEGQKVNAAEWQGTAREIMLAALQGRLPPNPFLPVTGWFNAEVWGSWSAEDGHRVRGVTDLTDARLVNEYQDLWLDRVNSRFQWHFRSKKDWTLHLADFLYDDEGQPWTAPRVSMARNLGEGLGLWISADQLPLGVPLRLARNVMSIYGTPWPASLPGTAGGTVSEFDLVLDANWRIALARGEVREGSVSDWERWPDLQGLTGHVDLGRNTGRLGLQGEEVEIQWPGMFREPISVTIPGCSLDLDWGQRWQVRFSACSLENADLAAHGEVVISGNEGRPSIDLNVAVTRGQVGQLDPYWPESVLNERVKQWLRKGLVAGELDHGRVSIHGDLDDWPFADGRGRFEAVASVSGGTIDYLEEWPEAREIDAVARFVGVSMDIEGRVGQIVGVPVRKVRANIPSFRAPVLTIDYLAQSTIPALLDFLQQTPLKTRIGTDLSRFEFAGPASAQGRVRVPFSSVGGELSVTGDVQLVEGRFSDPGLDISIGNISGQLTYSETGFSGTALEAEFQGRPARLDLAAQAESQELFRAGLEGEFAVADVIPGFLKDDLEPLLPSEGQCPWQLAVTVTAGAEKGESRAMLSVTSPLEGASLALPAPLDKVARERWPLRLSYPLSGRERVLQLEIADRIALRFDLPEGATSPRAGVLRLGGGRADMPPAGFLRIQGASETVDLDGWLDLVLDQVAHGKDMGELVLEWGRLTARELTFLDRVFSDVSVNLTVEEAGIRAEFASTDLTGAVRYKTGVSGSHSLFAEFERLVLGEPVSTGIEMDTNPGELPALHLYAQSLQYAGIEWGETRIEAYPIANGFHFDKIDASSERLKVQASGDWLLDERGQRSDFDIHFASESLGNFLQSLDFSSPVQGGQTLVHFNAWWPGAPGAFALSRLNGELEFSVVGGNITGASAGSGRLLGLLSVQALPKRLALDFRDVFDSGFVFDEATGTFQMENGMAVTDNVVLESSAATISVSGRTDLVAREYDQLLTIRPGVGNTLPIIGALAAGPGGAAAGLALQGLLQDQLSEATQVRYSITGPWEEPQFETIEVERQGG